MREAKYKAGLGVWWGVGWWSVLVWCGLVWWCGVSNGEWVISRRIDAENRIW